MQDAIRFTAATELVPESWNNGGGTFRQIAIHPDGVGPDACTWRIGATTLATPGPLATWQDMDRILLLTDGGPLRLVRHDTGRETLLEAGARLYSAAETPYAAEPQAGPVQAFDILLRRKQAHGCVDLRSGHQALPLRAGDTVLHCIRGGFQADLPARLGGKRTLAAGDTLHITLDYVPAFTLDLTPLAPDARLVDARLNLYPGRH